MQASVEIQVEFGKFFNVDLFQRGYYQLRCYLKLSPKLTFAVEVGHKNRGRKGNDLVKQIDGQIAKSEIFQILYRKEDLKLGDVFTFKVDFLLDILKTEEVFKELDLQLVIEMWFAEDDVGSNSLEKFQLLCHRSLKLNFDPLKGLHSNVSLLFDYFHLSAIILSIHASLLAFKHPVPLSIPAIKSSKPTNCSVHTFDLTGLELALFGPPIPPNSSNKNIVQAQKLRKLIGCQKHHLMCRYLLSAYESLQSSFELLATSLPSFVHQQFKIEHVDCVSKLEELVLKCKNLSEMNEAEEEDVLQVVNSDLTNLNTQLSILWAQYLELVTSNHQVSSHLAKDNHGQRVKRFAEGFFVREFSMAETLGCFDAGQHKHADISAKVRLSEYFKTVPPLPVECLETDGNHLTLPIIFEDVYSNVVVPPNAVVISSQPLASTTAVTAANNISMNNRKVSRAAQNRWAQRNNSLKNTGAARLTAISSIAPTHFSNTSNNSASNNSTSNTTAPTTVWATKTSLSTTTSVNELGYNNVNGNSSSSGGGSCGSGSNLVDISGTKVSLRRDKSINSTSSQESETQLNFQGPRKKRLSKFRPESLLLLATGSSWQQQQHQLHGSGLDHKGEQVAFDALDCQLVGYKKMDADHDHAPPMIELGTLVSDSTSVESVPKSQEDRLGVHETGNFEDIPIILTESIKVRSSSTGSIGAYNGSINSASNTSVEIISTMILSVTNTTSSAISSLSTISLPPSSETYADASLSAVVASTATTSISTTPQQHHFQTSCFLFSASSLPTLKDDSEEMATPDMNDSCLFVVAAGGGSLPELVGGVTKGSSDASGIARSECLDNLHMNRRLSPSKTPPSPSASVKSLPLFASGAEKDVISSVVIPANATTHAASLNCELHQDDCRTQVKGKYGEGIDVMMVTIETNCIEPVVDMKDSASYTELDEEINLEKDESSSALRLLTEECEKSTTSLREALSRMPDIDIEMSVEPSKEVKKDDLDQVDHLIKIAGDHTVSSSSVTQSEEGQASKKGDMFRRESRSMQISSHFHSQLISRRLVSKVTDQTVKFSHAKENLRKVISYQGHFYSDYLTQVSEEPYFWSPEKPLSPPKSEGVHLIICVHGLDGNSTDLRLVRTYLEMSLSSRGRVDFLMSERNQADTFSDFEVMTDRLVQEILYHIDLYSMKPSRISFIGHSLGNIIIRSALSRKEMTPLLPRLHTFLSLSGPHLGMLFNNSGLVNMGIWLMQKWKKSTSLLQLSLKDHHDPRQTFMYRLSQKQGLKFFSNVLLVGSQQDRYVPFHSSRIELCKAALRDTSGMGSVYTEMVTNLLRPVIDDAPQVQTSSSVQQQQPAPPSRQTVHITSATQHSRQSSLQQFAPTSLQLRPPSVFVRYDVYHALTSNTNNLIGRAAHIAVLDSELFIEKFITVSALKYFL